MKYMKRQKIKIKIFRIITQICLKIDYAINHNTHLYTCIYKILIYSFRKWILKVKTEKFICKNVV